MEKLTYVMWRKENSPRDAFNESLLNPLAAELLLKGVQRLQIHVQDKAVEPGAAINIGADLPAAVIGFWLPSAHAAVEVEPLMSSCVDRLAAYSVVESTVLPCDTPAAGDGRVLGFTQLAFFSRRVDISPVQFRDIWMNRHTANVLATQETSYYAQNIVNRAVTPDAPLWDGMVDAWYPLPAMTIPWFTGRQVALRLSGFPLCPRNGKRPQIRGPEQHLPLGNQRIPDRRVARSFDLRLSPAGTASGGA